MYIHEIIMSQEEMKGERKEEEEEDEEEEGLMGEFRF